MNETVLSCRGLKKTYLQGKVEVPVLLGVDLDIARGERVAIVGASGSGKSTLLHLLGGLDAPSAGEVSVQGRLFSAMDDAERGRVRNATLGFVYQFHHLLPEFTAAENVAMPLWIRRVGRSEALAQARRMLEEVGLGHRVEHTPGELSGGERQRCLLARALAVRAPVLLLDEPTTHLDPPHQVAVVRLLQRLARGDTVVSVLHDLPLALQADRVVLMQAGRVVAQGAHDDAQLHTALCAAFEHAIRIQRAGERFIAVPNL